MPEYRPFPLTCPVPGVPWGMNTRSALDTMLPGVTADFIQQNWVLGWYTAALHRLSEEQMAWHPVGPYVTCDTVPGWEASGGMSPPSMSTPLAVEYKGAAGVGAVVADVVAPAVAEEGTVVVAGAEADEEPTYAWSRPSWVLMKEPGWNGPKRLARR